MRSKLNSSPYYSYSAPSCSETVACDILLSRLFKCFRGIFCSTDRGTNKRMLCYAHSTHIQIRLDHDEILFSVFEPLFTTCLTRFPSSRDAGCPSQRSPIYAAGGSSARALYSQNRLPPLNFVSGGPLPWVIWSRPADFDDAEHGKPIWGSRLLEWSIGATVRDRDQTGFKSARRFSRCRRKRTRSLA